MGQRGPRAKRIKRRRRGAAAGEVGDDQPHVWERPGLTRSERLILFIESMPCTAGQWAGTTFKLRPWQREELCRIYRDDSPVRTVCWSMARGNGKTGIATMLILAALVGPEAQARGEIYAAANDKFQASRLFNEVAAIVERVPWLASRVSIRRHTKEIEDIGGNGSLFVALSSDVPTKHGLAPSFVVVDEYGQSRSRDLFDALETGMSKRQQTLMLVISTQAATDAMPMSTMIDYGLKCRSGEIDDPTFHLVLYAAGVDDDPWEFATWRKANPGLGDILSLEYITKLALQAKNLPAAEASFRNLCLNQRISVANVFITPTVWARCGDAVDLDTLASGIEVYAGLDLSAVSDLTALVLIGKINGKWHVLPTFWLPAEGLREKSIADRIPYDLWERQGSLKTTPGRTVSYERVAEYLYSAFGIYNIRKLAFDAWNFAYLKPWLLKAGFTESFITERFVEFRQGFKSFSPALRDLEQALLEGEIAHGNHPVLAMCNSHSVVVSDAAGNRKLDKDKSFGRIDGMIALAQALAMAPLRAPVIDAEALVW